MRVDFDKDQIKSQKLVPVEANEIMKTQKMQKKNSKAYISKVMSRRSFEKVKISLSQSRYPASCIQLKPVGPGLKQVLSNNGTRDQDVT